MTKKLGSLFEYVEVEPPTWYVPYVRGVDYKCDILLINSMTNNLVTNLQEVVLAKDKIETIVTK